MAFDSIFKANLFHGHTVMVTGGGSGIGRCTAHELAALGAKVILVGRKPEKLQNVAIEIAEALTPEVLVDWMRHVLDPIHGRVERWYLPATHSLNFLLENALGGGGVASLRIDPQGKAFAQQLLEIQIPVPQSIADQVN